ncbi:MAG: glycosyltransferase family 4 protein, partial [Promethearchaeota archaeon]
YKIEEKYIKVIPIGVDVSRFNPSKRSKEIREKYGNNILLFSGLMVPRKRVPVLLEAMTYVIKKIPNTQLILTGKGRFLNYYKKLSKSLGIEKNTTFLGFIDDNKLLEYYASSDIFVFPSEKEGFGQVFLEAMASGTPVICADKPPMSEIVGNGGKTFKLNDSIDLSKKIIELLNNREELARLRKNALEIVKNFDWTHITEIYNNYFKKIVNKF